MTSADFLNEMTERIPVLLSVRGDVDAAFRLLRACFLAGGKLMVAGNGGSAADADHIVGELMKGFLLERKIPEKDARRLCAADPVRGPSLASVLQSALPALSLCGQTALSSAFLNDRDPTGIFAQQVYGYGQAGDVFLAISTSGKAENLLKAAAAAKVRGVKVLALTGEHGGELADKADLSVRVPGRETRFVQELHQSVYHTLCAMLENEFFAAEE